MALQRTGPEGEGFFAGVGFVCPFQILPLRGYASLTRFKPSLERGLTLPRRLSSQKAFDAYVFVNVFPVNSDTIANEPPVLSFARRRVLQARVPAQWHSDASPVTKINRQRVIGYMGSYRIRELEFNGRSNHSTPPQVFGGFLR
jgi:hypothetical protein